MIIEKAIVVNGGLSPENIHITEFGSHCDGENFYFFESTEEAQQFYENV